MVNEELLAFAEEVRRVACRITSLAAFGHSDEAASESEALSKRCWTLIQQTRMAEELGREDRYDLSGLTAPADGDYEPGAEG